MGYCDMCDALHLPHSYYPYTETLSQSLTNGPDRLVRFSIVLTACADKPDLHFYPLPNFNLSALLHFSTPIHICPQGLAGFEVRYPFFRDFYRSPTSRITPQTWGAVNDGEASKTSQLNTMPLHQCAIHCIQNGCNCRVNIMLCQLSKSLSQ